MESGERSQAGGHERIRQELETIGRRGKARYSKIAGSRRDPTKEDHNDTACGASTEKRLKARSEPPMTENRPEVHFNSESALRPGSIFRGAMPLLAGLMLE